MNQNDIIQQGIRSAEFMAAQKPLSSPGHANQDAELKAMYAQFVAEMLQREKERDQRELEFKAEFEARIAALEARVPPPKPARRRCGNKQDSGDSDAPPNGITHT